MEFTTYMYAESNFSENETSYNITRNDLGGITRPGHPITVPAIMFATGVLGNLLALAVLYRSKMEHKHTAFYRLVGGLACIDLFGTVALSPVTITVYKNNMKWLGGQPMCDYFSFMMIFAGMATVLVVGVMAIERYYATLHPYAYEARFNPGRVTYMLIGVLVIATIIACFPLMGFGANVLQYPGTWCFFDCRSDNISDILFTYFYASVGILVIALTALCNAAVMCVLVKMRRHQCKVNTGQHGQLDNEAKMIALLAGIILVFATCYAPLMVRVIINQTKTFPVNHSADLLTIRLACLNQIFDPWVYILFRKEFFTRIWRLLYHTLCCKRKQTTSAAILEKPEVHSKSRLQTSKVNEDVFDSEECERIGKSAGLLLLKDCCSQSGSKIERKGSGRSLLIQMKQYGRYDQTIQNKDLRSIETGDCSD